jgi:hypothetical protein
MMKYKMLEDGRISAYERDELVSELLDKDD